jgi:8-hydroxy-5-deazaflavin:NADPH oxidoreductase
MAMKIGIIGAGRIGTNVGRLLAQAGHNVMFSFSRSEDKLKALAAEIGSRASYGTPAEAVQFAEAVLLAPPYGVLDVALQAGGDWSGKLVLDAVNPFTASGPRYVEGGTAAEEIAAKLPGARTVKTYNHIHFQHIAHNHHAEPRLLAFICGDDANAKGQASQLISDTGFDVWDLGGLYTARWTEPHGPLFNAPMTRAQAEPIVAALPQIKR